MGTEIQARHSTIRKFSFIVNDINGNSPREAPTKAVKACV